MFLNVMFILVKNFIMVKGSVFKNMLFHVKIPQNNEALIK